MSKIQALKTISFLWVSSLTGAFLAFLTQVVLARYLGLHDFGLFSSAMATVTLFSPLAGFGVSQYWLKVFGQEGWHAVRWIAPSFRFVFISTFSVISLLIIWAWIGPHEPKTRWLLFSLSFYIIGQVSIELVSCKLQLEERFTALSTWQVLPHLIRFFMISILSFCFTAWMNTDSVAFIYAVTAAGFVMAGAIQLRSLGKGRLDLKGHHSSISGTTGTNPDIFDVIFNAWPFGLAAFFHLIYFQSDIIMVKYLTGDEAAGLYNVAFSVMVGVYLLPGVIYQKFLLPKLHRWATHDRIKFRQIYRQGNIAMLALGSLAMISLWLTSDWVLPVLFSDQYKSAVVLLNILALSAPIIFVAYNTGATLVTQEHMRRKVKYMGYVALLNLSLNLLLIPLYGAEGAAVSTVLSNAILLLFYYSAAERVVFTTKVIPNKGINSLNHY